MSTYERGAGFQRLRNTNVNSATSSPSYSSSSSQMTESGLELVTEIFSHIEKFGPINLPALGSRWRQWRGFVVDRYGGWQRFCEKHSDYFVLNEPKPNNIWVYAQRNRLKHPDGPILIAPEDSRPRWMSTFVKYVHTYVPPTGSARVSEIGSQLREYKWSVTEIWLSWSGFFAAFPKVFELTRYGRNDYYVSRAPEKVCRFVPSDVPENVTVVYTIDVARSVCDHLCKIDVVAVDLEGRLSEDGSIDLLQITARGPARPMDRVYVFDLFWCREMIHELKKVLECQTTIKVLHDCRRDAQALFQLWGITMSPVQDTQVVHRLISYLDNACGAPRQPRIGLNDLLVQLRLPVNPEKGSVRARFAQRDLWQNQLTRELLVYSSADVAHLLFAHQLLQVALQSASLRAAQDLSSFHADQMLHKSAPGPVSRASGLWWSHDALSELAQTLSS